MSGNYVSVEGWFTHPKLRGEVFTGERGWGEDACVLPRHQAALPLKPLSAVGVCFT
jgi:hypothetical protein